MRFFTELKAARATISIKTDRRYFHRILPLLWIECLAELITLETFAIALVEILLCVPTDAYRDDFIRLGVVSVVLLLIICPVSTRATPKDYHGQWIEAFGLFATLCSTPIVLYHAGFYTGDTIDNPIRYTFTFGRFEVGLLRFQAYLIIAAAFYFLINLLLAVIAIHHYHRLDAANNRPPWEF